MVKRLIDRFDQQSDLIRSPDYNETTLRIDRLALGISRLATETVALHAQTQTAKLPHEKDHLRRQTEATDRQIDRLVYEPYGLTEEEIRIVEEAMR